MMRSLFVGALLFLPVVSGAAATDAPAPAAPTPAAPTPAVFDRFVRETGPACAFSTSKGCFEQIFRFADRDGDGALDLDEIQVMRDRSRQWLLAHSGELAPADKQAAVVTLLAIDFVGLDRLFASYDVDGDGLLTPDELSADIVLDERPVPVLAQDPDAVNWDQLLGRLGSGAAVLKSVLPKSKGS